VRPFFRVFGRFVTRGVQKRDKTNRGDFPQPPKKVLTYLRHYFFCAPPKESGVVLGPPHCLLFLFFCVFRRPVASGDQKHQKKRKKRFKTKSFRKPFYKTIEKKTLYPKNFFWCIFWAFLCVVSPKTPYLFCVCFFP
jgi:hypothetical protein